MDILLDKVEISDIQTLFRPLIKDADSAINTGLTRGIVDF